MTKLVIEPAPDLAFLARDLVEGLGWDHIDLSRVRFVRSRGSKTRAIARIWGLPRIFQVAFDFPPCYVIEVVSEKFDRLPKEEKEKTILHELMHIPKSFSGSLAPHKQFGKWRITERQVKKIWKEWKKKKDDTINFNFWPSGDKP